MFNIAHNQHSIALLPALLGEVPEGRRGHLQKSRDHLPRLLPIRQELLNALIRQWMFD